jgi:beta-ribofuranosylaminobenzene 5'-phosphate synthase
VPSDRVPFGLRIVAASRLSFTLIDLNGETGRRNGMASLALGHPSFQAVARPGEQFSLKTDANSAVHVDAIERFLHAVSDELDLPPVAIEIERGLPAHHGFGSKTTTLLAIGKVAAAVFGRSVTTERLAQLAGRAGTSGASVNLIDRGGYLVDGGHLNPDDFDVDPQKYLLPSRYAGAARKPPPLISLAFPPWPILCMITQGLELSGKPELDWFRQTLPIPAEAARATAHHVLMNLSTAVAEADYSSFCRALNMLTYEHHYKQEQIAIQPPAVRELFDTCRRKPEIDAVCISVTGPMCYAFTRDAARALAWCAELKDAGVLRDYFFTNAQNAPCRFEGVAL